METGVCSKCGSSKIINQARIVDYAHGNVKKDLSVQIQTTDNIVFNKFEKGQLIANICGSCGKVELSVSNPQELWNAYLKNKSL